MATGDFLPLLPGRLGILTSGGRHDSSEKRNNIRQHGVLSFYKVSVISFGKNKIHVTMTTIETLVVAITMIITLTPTITLTVTVKHTFTLKGIR